MRTLFSWITQFGLGSRDVKALLDDLHTRANRLAQSPFPFKNHLLVTFGAADVIEIAQFNHYFYFGEIAESSAQSFRHSAGLRCLDELPDGHHSGVHDIDGVMRENGEQPLFAIIYLKVSPIPKLVLPPEFESKPFVKSILDDLFKADSQFWSDYEDALPSELKPSRNPMVAPVIGMDSPEIVAIVRAERLEQIAALILAARNQRLGNIWNACGEIAFQAKALFPNIENIHDSWNSDPLFINTATTIGFLLLPESSKESGEEVMWRFEKIDKDAVAAKSATLLTHGYYQPGHLQEYLAEDPDTMIHGYPNNFIALFGPASILSKRDHGKLLEELSFGQMIDRFSHLESSDAVSIRPRGVAFSTEIAISIPFPSKPTAKDSEPGMVADDLLEELRMLLIGKRKKNFDHHAQDSWIYRWKKRARENGIAYSTTNDFINIIHTSLNYLERDPEGFSDMLPVIDRNIFEEDQENLMTHREIIWLYRTMEEMAVSRASQSYFDSRLDAMSLLYGTIGYKRSRDAFITFAEMLASHLDPMAAGRILVLESPGGGISCEIGPHYWEVIRISKLFLSYPIHWLIAHELAHGRLAHTPIKDLHTGGTERPVKKIISCFQEMRVRLDEHSMKDLLDALGHHLRSICKNSVSQLVVESIVKCLDKCIADVALRMSLVKNGDTHVETRRRFWFVHGPGLVAATRHLFGSSVPDMVTICTIITRFIFSGIVLLRFDRSVDRRADPFAHWAVRFGNTLKELEKIGSLEDLPTMEEADEIEEIMMCLHCLKDDLRIPHVKWLAAIRHIYNAIEHLERHHPEFVTVISHWLEFVYGVHEIFRIPDGSSAKRAAECYVDYLSDLQDDWQSPDPWPPFIRGHKMREDLPDTRIRMPPYFGAAISHRGGIFVQKAPGDRESQIRYHRMTSKFITRMAEYARQARYEKIKDYLDS